MKILFFMSHAGGARNFESTLRGLAERGHQVRLAFDRTEKRNLPGLSDLADSLVAEYEGITSAKAPRPAKDEEDVWLACWLRRSLDYMRYGESEFADSPKLRRRAESWVSDRVSKRYESATAAGRRVMRAGFQMTERSLPSSPTVEDYLRKQAPDAVLITPLLEPGSLQAEYLRVAKRIGIPTCLCVASWDNLTNKGIIHDIPDIVTLWNERQKDEAVRLHHVPADRVVVTGANAYDHWFAWEPSRTREEFVSAAGLDPSRPYVLYVGSSGFIAPSEASFIVEWISELSAHGLSEMQVLARPHPVNPLIGRDQSASDLDAMKTVVLFPRRGTNPTDVESRQDYFDSLYYSSAVVGVNTSAFLEGAILGRPVMTVLVPRYDETQRGQVHFHHLLTAGGGLLYAAETFAEHAADLTRALTVARPEEVVDPRSERFVGEFIRPYGRDVPATPILLDAIESLAAGTRAAPHRPNVASRVVGSALGVAARRSAHRVRENNQRIKHEQDAQFLTKAARRKLRKTQRGTSDGSGPQVERVASEERPAKTQRTKEPNSLSGSGSKQSRSARPKKPPKAPKSQAPSSDNGPRLELIMGSLRLPEALKLPEAPKKEKPPKDERAPRAEGARTSPKRPSNKKAPTADKVKKSPVPPKAPKTPRPPKPPKAEKPPVAPKNSEGSIAAAGE